MKIWPFTKLTKVATFNILCLLTSLFLNLAASFLIWRNLDTFPLSVPLWFSKPWGQDWLASPNFLWLIPTIGFLSTAFNNLAAKFFWSRERVLSLLLISASPIISGLLFFTLLEIIVVTS